MTLECPKCKASIARDGQKFCYRCGTELREVYAALNIEVKDPEVRDSRRLPNPPPSGPITAPQATQVLGSTAPDEAPTEPTVPAPEDSTPSARLYILLPTGDAYERELTQAETQIGKGPRNDLVLADPAVSSAHAVIRAEGDQYSISDIGSRNGTFVNGQRLTEPQRLNHGDVIGLGLSKLTFRRAADDTSTTLAADRTLIIQRPAPPPLTEESLANAVIAAGLATPADVQRLRDEGSGRKLSTALIEERLASEVSLRDLMGRTFKLPTVDLETVQIDQAV